MGTLVCNKQKDETYMDVNVWLVTKTDGIDNEVKIEQCLNDAVIERIREHVKEMSSMQTHCEIRPFYLDLLREWNIKEEIQNNHKRQMIRPLSNCHQIRNAESIQKIKKWTIRQ